MSEQLLAPPSRGDVTDEVIARIPPLVDLDAHCVEPPDIWTARLPATYAESMPRVVHAPEGEIRLTSAGYQEAPGTDGPDVAWWRYEDTMVSVKRTIAAAGFRPEEITLRGITFDEMRPGCWQRDARLADMDLNHVQAQMCYPNYPRFCGQVFLWGKDKELARLCVEAYNDWMVEEWCAGTGGRLIPLCLVPLWDVDLAVAELRRNAARGVRALAFSEVPAFLDLPSIHTGYWDPLFRVCEETGTVLCMHIGSGTRTFKTSGDAPAAVGVSIISCNSMASLADFLFSGVLHRFPKLTLLYAEAQIGWLPYQLERMDDVWITHQWAGGMRTCPEPPSTYYRRQVHSCFFKDSVGVDLLDRVGVDNVLFETDYPHQDSTWPHSRRAAAEQFGHLPQEQIDKIARGNAIRLFGLDLPPA